MPRPSLCPTVLSASVLLGGLGIATALDAEARPARVELAPSTAPDTAAKARPDADAARPSHAVTGHAAARVSGPWATTVLSRALAPAAAGAVTHQQDDPHVGAGKNLAIMGVGAAAIAVGPLVGDATSTGIAVGGGLLGLSGLYLFLRWSAGLEHRARGDAAVPFGSRSCRAVSVTP